MYNDMFPICTILYKTDNSEGWHYALMSGSENACKKKCKKLKKEHNWYDFKCYVSTWSAIKREYAFENTVPNAYDLHLCTDLIYNPYENKVYYPDEIMPYPNQRKRLVNNFDISVIGEGETEDTCIPDCEDAFDCGTDIILKFNNQKYGIVTIAENIKLDLPKFIDDLKKNGYACLSVEEYTFTKLFAWTINDRVRFILHYYGGNTVEIGVDKLLPKDLFFEKFAELEEKLDYYIDRHEKLYQEFKKKNSQKGGL